MKKLLFVTIMTLYAFAICSAQVIDTIYTKGGKPVQVRLYAEVDEDLIEYWNEYYTILFPNAVFLDNSSVKYNCHSYTWNLTDGGSLICWIEDSIYYYDGRPNEPNVSKYWTNDYYQQTTLSASTKVDYYRSNHSAVPSPTVTGMFESKWGSGPLMRHAPDYGPYEHMTDRHYYRHVNVDYGLITCSNGYGTIGVNIAANYSPASIPNRCFKLYMVH